jgi:hypothetical protein
MIRMGRPRSEVAVTGDIRATATVHPFTRRIRWLAFWGCWYG